MTHSLKTWPEFYKAIESGDKTFELRRMDKPFKVGDILLLQEYDPKKSEYTGKETKRTVTYILHGDLNKFGLFADFCVMGIAPPPISEMEQYVAIKINYLREALDKQEREKLLDDLISKIFWQRKTEFITELNSGHETWKEFNDSIRFYISRILKQP